MSFEIDLFDETESIDHASIQLVENTLQHAYKKLDLKDSCECSVTFVSNERIQEINKDYRNKNQPTDVISFALEEGGDPINFEEDGQPRVLGDIIISVPKAREQAKEYGHSFERELGFLATHGFLHLLGYDHMNPEDEKEMFGLQDFILESFGLKRFE